MSNNEVIFILNGLVETCERGERGFRSAAESVRNSEFRRLFNIFAQQRVQFMTELQAEIHRLGGEAGKAGSQAARAPSSTIPFRPSSLADTRDEAAIIAECQREEEAAGYEYSRG